MTSPFLAERDRALAAGVLSARWFADGIDEYESWALSDLASLAGQDTSLAAGVLSARWFADGIDEHENWAIGALASLNGRDPALARRAFEYVEGERYWDRDLFMINSLATLAKSELIYGEGGLALLREQSWFTDGLSPEERALIVVLEGSAKDTGLVESYFTQSATTTLPLAGEVNLYVFYHDPFPHGDRTLELLEQTVRGAEQVMGAPFPVTDVILRVADASEINPDRWGAYKGSSMWLRRYDSSAQSGDSLVHPHSLFHETAHYYFNDGPAWVVEGGAEFVGEYSASWFGYELQWEGGEPFERQCEGYGWEKCLRAGDLEGRSS